MSKTVKHLWLLIFLAITASCSVNRVEAVWYEGDPYTMVIKNLPRTDKGWTVWFSTPALKNLSVDSLSTADMLEVEGNFYRIVPRAGVKAEGDSVVVRYRISNKLSFRAWAPEGLSFQKGFGKPRAITTQYVYKDLEPDADRVAAFTSRQKYIPTAVTDMIPALKTVTPIEGEPVSASRLTDDIAVEIVEGHPEGWYHLIIADSGIQAQAADRSGALYAKVTLSHLAEASGDAPLPAMEIEDWPDFSYRGLMLDPTRHFIPVWKLKEYIRLMTRYKLNVLHLRLADDDSWRLETPAIPRLTEFGAFRAVPKLAPDGTIREVEALQPSWDGTVSRKDTTRMANGFYTREEFKDLLRFADSLCISIVPEFDMPGHSRAVVHCLPEVTDPADTSAYTSPAGGYHRNCLDVSLEETYRFISTAMDNVISIYSEAGIPLPEIHLGGDEVARGAWMGSPSCHRLLEASGFDVSRLSGGSSSAQGEARVILRSYFTNRVLDLAKEKGIKVAGWHELAGNLDEATRERLSKEASWINYWRSKPDGVHKLLNDGFRVIISNGANTYADEAYSLNREEFGNSWAGVVDEKRTFALLPFDMYRSIRWNDNEEALDLSDPGKGKTALLKPDNIKGVQVQLFMGGAVRKYADIDYMLFPKSLGAFDRAWNARPSWSSQASDPEVFLDAFNRFYSIIVDREMPWFRSNGIKFHLPQPCIRVEDGKLEGYSPIPGAEIRYEFGSATPTASSPLLEGAVSIPDSVTRVTARTFYLGQTSVSTTLATGNKE
ncbi:MAG: family 20 glycosylhydrolase [Bacteroidales bacterium]|nr:family 20 glycosylhydrolase [Bacteroidales bacterium]